MNILEKSRSFAIRCHRETNHLYGGHPYEVHLKMVADMAEKFIELIPDEDRDIVLSGCWVHDCIEDCRQTYNDVKAETNEAVAELAYALTNEKGRSREERANDKYYQGIRDTKYAVFIKVCDRLANVTYSKSEGNPRMVKVYQQENEAFMQKLHDPNFQPLFDYLASLFEGNE